MKKILLVLLIVSLFSSVVVNAQITGTIHESTSNILIEGLDSSNANKDATVYMVKKGQALDDENIGHIGQMKIKNDGSYTYKFKFDKELLPLYDLCVKVGGSDITETVSVNLVQGEFFTVELNVTTVGGTPYIAQGDTVKLSAKINNLYGDNNQPYTLVFAAYNDQGILCGTSISTLFGAPYSGEEINSTGAKIPENATKIKAFVWGEEMAVPASNTSLESDIKENFIYKNGDVVAFLGDSITAGVGTTLTYPMYIEYFYQTRYPDRNISFYNFGIPNDTTYGAYNRLGWDVYDTCTPTKATIMFGFNDVVWVHQSNSLTSISTLTLKNSIDDMERIVNSFNNKGIKTCLITPTVAGANFDVYPLVDPAMDKYSEMVISLGDKLKLPVVDWHTPLNKIKDDGFDVTSDQIHPKEDGQMIMSYLFLKQQGNSDLVAEVCYKDGQLTAKNASVTALTDKASVVSFNYTPKALPLANNSHYQEALSFVPLTKDLNREIIKIEGLAPGRYELLIDGQSVKKGSEKEFANGINIALSKYNPNQALSCEIADLLTSTDMYNNFYSLRHIAQMNQLMKGAGVDYTNIDYSMSDTSPEYTNNAVYDFFNSKYPTKMDIYYHKYMACMKNLDDINSAIATARAEAKNLSVPKTLTVKICEI